MVLGAIVAGVPNFFQPARLLELTLMVALTSIALIGLMFFIMARISDRWCRAPFFGVLNTLLYFPAAPSIRSPAFPGGCG